VELRGVGRLEILVEVADDFRDELLLGRPPAIDRGLADPGDCRKLGRACPISTTGRDDGGTDYSMTPEVAALFTAARAAVAPLG